MGVGDATSGYGRGDSLPELVDLNRQVFFEIADLAMRGGFAVDLSNGPLEDRHTLHRGLGYAKVNPVTAEWISPPIPIEDMGDDENTLTAVGILLERGTSREALLGFFAASSEDLKNNKFEGSLVIDPRRQSGQWHRTYVIDGYVSCGRDSHENAKQNDELYKVAQVPLFGKTNVNLARKRIPATRNKIKSQINPFIPAYVLNRGMGDRVG